MDVAVTTRTALACLYTRHNDGHVRERHLRAVIRSSADWVPPFIVQLLGEYVIEIHRVIESNVDCLGQESYLRFVAKNPVFMKATRQPSGLPRLGGAESESTSGGVTVARRQMTGTGNAEDSPRAKPRACVKSDRVRRWFRTSRIRPRLHADVHLLPHPADYCVRRRQ